MVKVVITDTQTGKERELKGDFAMGFVARVDEVFGEVPEGFVFGRVGKELALKTLKRYYKETVKALKRR